MKQHVFDQTVGTIFLIIGLVHLARVVHGWSAVINGWTVPFFFSWVVVVIAGYLSYHGFQLAKHK